MLKVALTGGIGSGKTVIANLFSKLGITIIDADQISHAITQIDGAAYHAIINHFGHDIVSEDNTLNRKILRDIVFTDQKQKKVLESILHPLIQQEIESQIHQAKTDYVIAVIPLLIESSYPYDFDRVCVISTSPRLQLTRASERDQCSHGMIQSIIDQQATNEQRLARADDVIANFDDLPALKKHVHKLHQFYLSLCKKMPQT